METHQYSPRSPWHTRIPNPVQLHRYRNIVDFHQLTLEFLGKLSTKGVDLRAHLKRVQGASSDENLSVLEKLTETTVQTRLMDLLDDSDIDDLLDRMEKTVWIAQAWSIRSIFEKAPKNEAAALLGSLEQSAWRAGKLCGETRWPNFSENLKGDLRNMLAAIQTSPMAGFISKSMGGTKKLLLLRSTQKEIQFEFLGCPHLTPFTEVKEFSETLCGLHIHWIRGFVYGLYPELTLEYFPTQNDQKTRCRMSWTLA